MVFGNLFRRTRPSVEAPGQGKPSVPDGVRVYAVGDIHGRADLLRLLRAGVEADLAGYGGQVLTVFLGDYVDRGPASAEVIDILARREWPTGIIALRGNHEVALDAFARSGEGWATWQQFGALPTLASYGTDVRPLMAPSPTREVLEAVRADWLARVPASHLALLDGLYTSTAAGDYFFCHAGVRPGIPIAAQDPADLLTIREPFLSSDAPHGRIIVHGHTPLERPVIRPNRIGIDTGAYATGRLTALVLEGTERAWLMTGDGPVTRRSIP